MARILVVDNERDTLEILSIAIRLLGHAPMSAISGKEALDRISQDPPDLVLLDYMMPGLDGIETLQRIRKLDAGKNIPTLLVTASSDRSLEERIAFAGGDGCVQKPMSLPQLTEVISRYVQAPVNEYVRRYGT